MDGSSTAIADPEKPDIALGSNDLSFLQFAVREMSQVNLPSQGSINSFTRGAAIFVDEKGVPNKKTMTGINGNNVSRYYHDVATLPNHNKDAELGLLTQLDTIIKEKTKGTLYMALSKGCCPSCRAVIQKFRKYYENIRIVIYYSTYEKTAQGVYGFTPPAQYPGVKDKDSGPYYKIFPAKSE